MPKISKSLRREKQRAKRQQMVVDGRGLISDVPNWDERKKKAKRNRKIKEILI